ncbi:tryptophan dimethylallyltransferase family protein [Nocardia salmonicida]|uniref:tryptophan dimethylallyltransferase family protein n=1 Tax=Nocardia salmonicida TaxID=53431 RepID=UPI0009EF5095|nr:tryptophan dimethylallyltransferase family protein [Nocardia salmonicida]
MLDISYAVFLCQKWDALCAGFGIPESEYAPISSHIRAILDPWGDWSIGQIPRYQSFVSGDGFPAEISLSFADGVPEFRILFESLGNPATSLSCRQAGADLTERLADEFGVHLGSYDLVKGLFLPGDSDGGLIWHSLAWRPGSAPRYKVYLGTQVNGPEQAYDVVGKAMARLGMSSAWSVALDSMTSEQRSTQELDFFALDLSDEPTARAKVYLRHHGVTAVELNRFAGLAALHRSSNAIDAYRKVVGDQDRILTDHPLTCLAFRQGDEGVAEATTYLRLPGAADSDAVACDTIASVADPNNFDVDRYRAAITGLASGGSPGVQELVGLRTRHDELDATIYLRFDVYGPDAVAPETCSCARRTTSDK